MKKNTLFVSLLAGLGSLAAIFTVINNGNESQYSPREVANDSRAHSERSQFFEMMRKNVNTGKVEPQDYLNAVEEARNAKRSRATSLNWGFTGPDNVGGRTRAVIIDNEDPDRIYAGSIGGGMFLSTNAAGTWTYKSDGWENLHISTIAQNNDGVIYVGTGSTADNGTATNGAFPGNGIYVSSDRGETWSHMNSTLPVGSEWNYVNRIAVSENKNSNGEYSIYAATNKGLRVSVDGGDTWYNPVKVAPACVTSFNTDVSEVVLTSDDRALISVNGVLFVSEDGTVDCSYQEIGAQSGIGSCSRLCLAVCPSDENIVYAFQTFNTGPRLADFKVLVSNDGGLTWDPNAPAAPTTIIDPNFNLMGSNGAGYNEAISVDPNDCERIYVGAVELYRVKGAWASVATNFGAPGFYVHSDKHWFQFSQHTPNTMYVASDGGIGKTENANATNVTWTENNRHYGTAQYYGIAFAKDGRVIGGTQDNGSHIIDPRFNGDAGKDASELSGGDGFDCEVSNIGEFMFSTLYYGRVIKHEVKGDEPLEPQEIHTGQEGQSPFHTVIRLWESTQDLTSKDSVVYLNSSEFNEFSAGDGVSRSMTGVLEKSQESGDIVPGSVLIKDLAGGQEAKDINADGVLFSLGSAIGTVNYASGSFELRWSFAPPLSSTISGSFDLTFNLGDTLNMVSQNAYYKYNYVLTSNLNVGDSVTIQDPVQTLMAVSRNNGVVLSRQALNTKIEEDPKFENLDIPGAFSPTAMEFSNDGNHLFVADGSGGIYRVSNLNNWYTGSPNGVLDVTRIFSGSGPVAGINLHPTDPERLIATLGGFGNRARVFELTAAESSNGISVRRDISGDLPDFPVYDPEYNVHNTNQLLIGTELGLWACDDISETAPSWTQQSSGLGNVPVIDVRQQRLNWDEAANYGTFYLGTFGRGIWSTRDLVSVDDNWDDFITNDGIDNVKVYPNPVSSMSKISFDMPRTGLAQVSVYDITGKMIINDTKTFTKGKVEYELNGLDFSAGTYFATISLGSEVKQAKFVVVK